MNKVYTIINIFSVGDYADFNECWVANYTNREDAIKAFEFKLRERYGQLGEIGIDDNGCITNTDGSKMTLPELFDDMVSCGYCYETGAGSSIDHWFIRDQEIQSHYDEERISIS